MDALTTTLCIGIKEVLFLCGRHEEEYERELDRISNDEWEWKAAKVHSLTHCIQFPILLYYYLWIRKKEYICFEIKAAKILS